MRMKRSILAALLAVTWAAPSTPARAQLTVFDPANYHANVLIDTHALEQIANQVRQLDNEAQMLLRLEQNLRRLNATIAPDLQRQLSDIASKLGSGAGMRLEGSAAAYEQLFPRHAAAALSGDDVLRNGQRRAQEEYQGLERSALLQAEIADGITGDRQLLADVMARSRAAVGALEAAQAGNELTGLSVKQALALQGLLAAQHRAATLARARDVAGEDEARQRFKTFLGPPSAYGAGR